MAVYLSQLQVNDFKSFKGQNIFDFAHFKGEGSSFMRLPQCNVFLGDNGTGKTNLLKIIANLQPKESDVKDISRNDKTDNSSEITDYNVSLGISVGDPEMASPQKTFEKCYRPAVYERYEGKDYTVHTQFVQYKGLIKNLKTTDFKLLGPEYRFADKIVSTPYQIGYTHNSNSVAYDVEELSDVIIYAYGVNRFSDSKRNLNSDVTVDTLFHNDRPLINLEEWLFQLDMARKSKEQGQKAQKRINQIKTILKKGNLFPGVNDYRIDVDGNLNVSVKFITEHGELPYHNLGYGYQCMMAWVFDFMKKMFDRYPDAPYPLEMPAILLIDEIDLHLHPHWQRHVLRDLCDLFPATQIIASTHSPLVIQSANSMNLFLLNNENGCTCITKYPFKTFQGWSVEEILDELMDMGPDTRAEEYRKLRADFEHALNAGDVDSGIRYYTELKEMLYPGSAELDLLEMDINQLKSVAHD